MKNYFSVSFTLKLLMRLLSLGNKLEQSSDNYLMELTFISCLAFIFINPNLQYLLKVWLMQPGFILSLHEHTKGGNELWQGFEQART